MCDERVRERENVDTRAYNVDTKACVGGYEETCGRGCKVGVYGLYAVVWWMEGGKEGVGERIDGMCSEGGKYGKRIKG